MRFERKKRKEIFTIRLNVCKMGGKNCANILKWVFRNLKTLKSSCPTESQKKNTDK